jgi:hypothetical protein
MSNWVSMPVYRLQRILRILQAIPEKTDEINAEIINLLTILDEE